MERQKFSAEEKEILQKIDEVLEKEFTKHFPDGIPQEVLHNQELNLDTPLEYVCIPIRIED